jgi:antitoxin ParD1/3/4/toxin ParE1/3/4
MSNYVLTPEADEDLAEIWEYIAQDDIEAADRWDAKLRDAFEMLARSPRLGHARKDLTDFPVLFWPVGEYLILYRVRKKQLEVFAVTQGSRDIPSFLRGRAQ